MPFSCGITPLMAACKEGQRELYKTILSHVLALVSNLSMAKLSTENTVLEVMLTHH